MGTTRGTAATLLCRLLVLGPVALGLGGCFGSSGSTGSEPSSPPSSIPVSVSQPHARGPFPARLQAGLPVLTPDRCEPSARRVCSTDATRSWAPVDSTAPVTVADVSTHLAHGHSSWTTVVAFSPEDSAELARWSRGASSVGGDVLVLGPDRTVLAALPPSTIHDDRSTLTGLDKGVAWAVVEGFSRD